MKNKEISNSKWGSNPYYYLKSSYITEILDMIKVRNLLGHLLDYES